MNAKLPVRLLLVGLLALSLTTACAADTTRYNAEPARTPDVWGGFWGILTAVLIFGMGILVGATLLRKGSIRLSSHRGRHRRRTEAGWKRVRQHIQEGTKQGLAEWRSTGRAEEPDWGDLSRRIEERIFEEMRKHPD